MRVLSTGTGPVRRDGVSPRTDRRGARRRAGRRRAAGPGYLTVPPGGGMPDHAHGEPTALVVPLTGELLISGSGAAHQGKVTVGVVVLLDQGGAAPASIDRLRQDHVRVAEAPGRGRRGEIVDVITQQQLAAPARLPGGYRASESGRARAEHWYLLTEGPLIDLDQLRPDQADDAVLNRLTHLRAGEHVEPHGHGDPRRLWRRLQRRAPGAHSRSERRDDDRDRWRSPDARPTEGSPSQWARRPWPGAASPHPRPDAAPNVAREHRLRRGCPAPERTHRRSTTERPVRGRTPQLCAARRAARPERRTPRTGYPLVGARLGRRVAGPDRPPAGVGIGRSEPGVCQDFSRVSSMIVGSTAVRACGAPGAICNQKPGPASSSAPSTVNRSRPVRTCTIAALAAWCSVSPSPASNPKTVTSRWSSRCTTLETTAPGCTVTATT